MLVEGAGRHLIHLLATSQLNISHRRESVLSTFFLKLLKRIINIDKLQLGIHIETAETLIGVPTSISGIHELRTIYQVEERFQYTYHERGRDKENKGAPDEQFEANKCQRSLALIHPPP